MTEDFRDYQEIRLVASEAMVLEELEAQLGYAIPHVTEFDEDTWFGFIAQNDYITNLTLAGVGLSSISESIVQLQRLQVLDFNNNQLSSLPESIGQLPRLQKLDLYNNQLSSLPDTLGQLQSLQILALYNNQLLSLPESFGQLQSLQILALYNNQLSSLPESFGQLQSLQDLWLQNNQLSSLPKSIGQLQHLQRILLKDNPLDLLTPLQISTIEHTPIRTGIFEALTHISTIQRENIPPPLDRECPQCEIILVRINKNTFCERCHKLFRFDPSCPFCGVNMWVISLAYITCSACGNRLNRMVKQQ